MQLIPLALPVRFTWCSLLSHCGVKSDSRKLQFGHIDTEHQCRSWFGVFSWTRTFPQACGVGKNSACGHGTCSQGRNLEYVHSFNLRIRLCLLVLGFGLALKGIKPSHLKFYSAMVIRSAWSTQECSLSITCKRYINFGFHKLSKNSAWARGPDCECLLVGFFRCWRKWAAQLITGLTSVSPIYLVRQRRKFYLICPRCLSLALGKSLNCA